MFGSALSPLPPGDKSLAAVMWRSTVQLVYDDPAYKEIA